MRILIVTQYFWPEPFIINDIVEALVAQGHHVRVLTGKPNYPGGEILEGYAQHGVMCEKYAGADVLRVPLRPRGGGGAKNLALNYLSFVWNGLRYFPGSVKGQDFDLIFACAFSPITSVIPAVYLKWKLKRKLVVWIQDLWPESLSATGFIRNPLLLRMVGWMVRAIYANCDALLVQSRAFHKQVAHYTDPQKIDYFPNPYRDVATSPASESTIDPDLLSMMEHYFCVVFAGNIGTAQAVETWISAAERLKHVSEIKLVLVGSGSMLNWIQQQKAAKGLDNIIIAGRYPQSEMPYLFKRASALLVTLKRAEIFSYTVPSKIQAYMSAGKPIIAGLDGEGARIVSIAEAGVSCASEDADGLADCIERVYKMSDAAREKLGRAGRDYFLAHFELKQQCSLLGDLLQQKINEKEAKS